MADVPLPSVRQRPSVGKLAHSASDTMDFGSNPNSPSRHKAADKTPDEPSDYWNGGHPHESVSPQHDDASARPAPPRTPEPFATSMPPADLSTLAADPHDLPSPPPGRRSVQFARGDSAVVDAHITPSHSRNPSWDTKDAIGKFKGSAFMSKLKELTLSPDKAQRLPPPPLSSASQPGSELGSAASSPTTARHGSRALHNVTEGSEDDADVEETADEDDTAPEYAPKAKKKRKRRMRRPKPDEVQSTPATPRLGAVEPAASGHNHHHRMRVVRRATMPGPGEARGGLSEGEGRDHLSRGALPWALGRAGAGDDADETESPSGRRMGHFRRISVFGGGGGGVSDGDAMTPRRPFFGSGERASTFGAQKWRQVKKTLKLLRQKKDERFDYYKSAELMAELRAGAPAVLLLASMIQRDEHGNKRIPVLLEQLRLTIRDSTPVQDRDSERHWLFAIDLEYGSGPSRMRWTVKRTIREILNLHWKYKLALGNEKYLPTRAAELGARPKQPKFPLSAFPYLRGVRGLEEDDEAAAATAAGGGGGEGGDQAYDTAGELTAGEYTATDNEGGGIRPAGRKKKTRILGGARRKASSALGGGELGGSAADISHASALDPVVARRRYVERQQRVLEKYLQETIRWLMFRADSNRLCRFLELSALGVRLAAEGSYHGKECYLHIQSSKGIDFRRVLTPAKVIARHTRKWFLVRQSYIVCVESPENMNIYDVYLVDPKFRIVPKKSGLALRSDDDETEKEMDLATAAAAGPPPPESHHTLKLLTSERKVKLFSRNHHIIRQFEESIADMLKTTPWHRRNRFGSFAPVRGGVHAQWLVDGRDYMWNVSRAINMARDVIYIHDWWLSPELYMRRPACISQKWRLDRLLQRKAREGVKVFVIVYRNVEAAIPIDSEHTKFSLLNLHPNIFIQRSPNQLKKNQFFFAHHEKLCVVDHDVAFVGGIDLCFGRWDCPQHPVADDKPTGFEPHDSPKDAEHCQLFPGKDYSNPRVQDFFRLAEPYEEMYDRSRVPRMPWHDVSMQLVGQPARDLTRHFVQRWNYVRRGRKPTRPTPFLLPPPDYDRADLEALGLTGTCEVQILRSATAWSLGIDHTEASIQAAYVKMIEDSEHFVYMENQFFITSSEILGNKITNRIGDALVERILRAHRADEEWRAVVVIPLMPGFQNEVNEQDGTSVRLILQCQYRSICRGEQSIFARLRAAGIDPEDYIQFFCLRQWGRIGADDALTTEQLYVHAKVIIVDDRVALVGSANINERSMLGSRDSEVAAVVRDTDMLWSTMAGRPYRVGRFAHTLRLRLMREHLGLDVDEILEEERQADLGREADFESEMDGIYGDSLGDSLDHSLPESSKRQQDPLPELNLPSTVDPERQDSPACSHPGRDSVVVNGREVLAHTIPSDGTPTRSLTRSDHHHLEPVTTTTSIHSAASHIPPPPPMPPFDRRTTEQLGLPRANQLPSLPVMDDSDIGGPPAQSDAKMSVPLNPLTLDVQPAAIDKDCMRDPVDPAFYDEIWARTAENNTKIYRRVFRCMPDSDVTNWAEYKEFKAYAQRFRESMEGHHRRPSGEEQQQQQQPDSVSSPVAAPPAAVAKALTEKAALTKSSSGGASEKPPLSSHGSPEVLPRPGEDISTAAAGTDDAARPSSGPTDSNKPETARGTRRTTFSPLEKPPTSASGCSSSGPLGNVSSGGHNNNNGDNGSAAARASALGSQNKKQRRRANTRGSRRGFTAVDEVLGRPEAEELLGLVRGTVVQFPYDWLLVEETNGNWLFQVDQVAPLQIYN